MNANPPGYGKVLKETLSGRPIRYHLLLVVRTSGYRPLTIPLYPQSYRRSPPDRNQLREIPMYSKPLRSLRKWGTNVYGLSNSPVFKNHRRNLFCRPRTDIQCTAFGYRSLSKPIRRPMLVAVWYQTGIRLLLQSAKVDEVRFETKGTHLLTGKLDQQLMAEDEQLFQQLWRTYFKTIAIKNVSIETAPPKPPRPFLEIPHRKIIHPPFYYYDRIITTTQT